MRQSQLSLFLLLAALPVSAAFTSTAALSQRPVALRPTQQSLSVSASDQDTAATSSSDMDADSSMTQALISKLRFRELKSELETRHLPVDGTTAQLRSRLREAIFPGAEEECIIDEDGMGDDCKVGTFGVVSYVDDSDPEFEAKELVREMVSKSEVGHWKAATRKLKRLVRRFPDYPLPEESYLKVLEACTANRLQGARASEPTRKILEQMVEHGYSIPEKIGNFCVKNCLGESADSTHQGFGGIDTALAMVAALEQAGTPIQLDTYDKVCVALAKEGSMDEALTMLRSVVVDRAQTPPLSTFCDIAKAAVDDPESGQAEKVMTLLAYLKAAGYDLDSIGSTQDGRTLLACGMIAAERMGNTGLGLRMLTAASKAEGVDRGDQLISLDSPAAQRASMLLHKRAISMAVQDDTWKLAVKLLELMLERSLRPSSYVWRSVVICCAKSKKSKRAVSLLLDWVRLAEHGAADKPPLSIFNTCVNACEICGEEELTLVVLDAMKKTHDTDGNMITFNIALKRLAKQHNYLACEGIIIGMLQEGIEPSVVSYTTAIAACASPEDKQPKVADEWLKRMRTRGVFPNVLTYNTALAACLDGTLESTVLGSKMAAEMLVDVDRQFEAIEDEGLEVDEYTIVTPNSATKTIAKKLLGQLAANCKEGLMDKRVAGESVALPLQQLVRRQGQARKADKGSTKENVDVNERDEAQLEFDTAARAHRFAEV